MKLKKGNKAHVHFITPHAEGSKEVKGNGTIVKVQRANPADWVTIQLEDGRQFATFAWAFKEQSSTKL